MSYGADLANPAFDGNCKGQKHLTRARKAALAERRASDFPGPGQKLN
jgi:hypothetical protein